MTTFFIQDHFECHFVNLLSFTQKLFYYINHAIQQPTEENWRTCRPPLVIDGFTYDGTGPDAFFWVGTQGTKPSTDGIILPHPFQGT